MEDMDLIEDTGSRRELDINLVDQAEIFDLYEEIVKNIITIKQEDKILTESDETTQNVVEGVGEPQATFMEHAINENIDPYQSIQKVDMVGISEPVVHEISEEQTHVLKNSQNLMNIMTEECGNKLVANSCITVTTPECSYTEERPCLSSRTSLAHEKTYFEDNAFICRYCPKRFPNLTRLKKHQKVHSSAKPYACDKCPKSFKDRGALVKHQVIHSGIRPFVCPICYFTFYQKVSLKKHVSSHVSRQIDNICEICAIQVKNKSELCSHMEEHFKDHSQLPHARNVSELLNKNTQAQMSAMPEAEILEKLNMSDISTVRYEDENLAYPCPHCDMSFKCNALLNLHLLLHLTTCKHCKTTFPNINSLEMHECELYIPTTSKKQRKLVPILPKIDSLPQRKAGVTMKKQYEAIIPNREPINIGKSPFKIAKCQIAANTVQQAQAPVISQIDCGPITMIDITARKQPEAIRPNYEPIDSEEKPFKCFKLLIGANTIQQLQAPILSKSDSPHVKTTGLTERKQSETLKPNCDPIRTVERPFKCSEVHQIQAPILAPINSIPTKTIDVATRKQPEPIRPNYEPIDSEEKPFKCFNGQQVQAHNLPQINSIPTITIDVATRKQPEPIRPNYEPIDSEEKPFKCFKVQQVQAPILAQINSIPTKTIDVATRKQPEPIKPNYEPIGSEEKPFKCFKLLIGANTIQQLQAPILSKSDSPHVKTTGLTERKQSETLKPNCDPIRTVERPFKCSDGQQVQAHNLPQINSIPTKTIDVATRKQPEPIKSNYEPIGSEEKPFKCFKLQIGANAVQQVQAPILSKSDSPQVKATGHTERKQRETLKPNCDPVRTEKKPFKCSKAQQVQAPILAQINSIPTKTIDVASWKPPETIRPTYGPIDSEEKPFKCFKVQQVQAPILAAINSIPTKTIDVATRKQPEPIRPNYEPIDSEEKPLKCFKLKIGANTVQQVQAPILSKSDSPQVKATGLTERKQRETLKPNCDPVRTEKKPFKCSKVQQVQAPILAQINSIPTKTINVATRKQAEPIRPNYKATNTTKSLFKIPKLQFRTNTEQQVQVPILSQNVIQQLRSAGVTMRQLPKIQRPNQDPIHTEERPIKYSKDQTGANGVQQAKAPILSQFNSKPITTIDVTTRKQPMVVKPNNESIHTGEKPSKYLKCPEAHKQTANLQAHLIAHSVNGEYSCKFCALKFPYFATLKRHEQLCHNQFLCPICSESTADDNELHNHIKHNHAVENNLSCTLCKSGIFIDIDEYCHHMIWHCKLN